MRTMRGKMEPPSNPKLDSSYVINCGEGPARYGHLAKTTWFSIDSAFAAVWGGSTATTGSCGEDGIAVRYERDRGGWRRD
jgi:hypothetical protein